MKDMVEDMENNNFSQEIFNRDYNVAEGLHLIEASAGTGKTYNIQNVYARLIMETGCRVGNILVMTFTEAATKELQERLRMVLTDLQKRFRTPKEDCDSKEGRNEKEIQEIEKRNQRADNLIGCVSDKDAARMRIELAILEFDGAAIFTIHGFCQRVLARYAFETGMNFSQEIKNNKNAELKTLAEDWWRIHKDIPLKDLVHYVKILGNKACYTIVPCKDIFERTLDGIRKIEEKRSWDDENRTFEKLQNVLEEILDKKKSVDELDMGELLGFLKKAIDFKVKGATREAGSLYKIWSNYLFLKTPDEIVAKYEKDRFERESLNFDDLLRALSEALQDKTHGKDLADKLREEYQAALIDEFQDTDPVQYDIFKRIFIDCKNPGPLYFVGDPKQAIYAFRGGDIYTYFNAKGIKGLQNHILNVNHRSTRRLVDAVNIMFGEKTAGETFGIDIPYIASKVDEEPEIKGDPLDTPLQIIEFSPEEDKPSKGKYTPAIMERMTDEILALLEKTDAEGKRIFSPKDIAILMGAKTDMPTLQQKLLAKGIPSVIRDSGNVFQSPISYELLVFLLAVSKTDNPRREEVRAALLTVFGGVAFDEADNLDNQVIFAERVAELKELKDTWRSQGFPAMVSRMEERGYMLRLAQKPDGRRLLSDIGQILELCCAATKEVGSAPEALVDWLEERISDANSDDVTESEEYARELETDGKAVRIMTIHASKGLQFPVVFLPDCWRINFTKESHFYHKENDGVYQLYYSKDDVEDAKKESTQEKKRLLYVALTRAKQQTVLFAPSKWPNDEPLRELLGNLRENAGENPPYEWQEWQQPLDYKGIREPYTVSSGQEEVIEAGRPRTDWDLCPVKGSYSSLAPGHAKGDDDSRDNDDVLFFGKRQGNGSPQDIFDLPAGPRIGTCWHDILEKVAFDADAEAIRQIAETELLANGFSTDETTLDITVKMIEDTLNHKLAASNGVASTEEVFSLRDIGWSDRLSELEFNFSSANAEKTTIELKDVLQKHWMIDETKKEFINAMQKWNCPIPRGYLKGFIDLVFRHNGAYYVVDWKSNMLDKDIRNFTVEGIRGEMAKNGYFFQYMLYAAVLHCYLKQRLGESYSYERHFGGVRYYFLRGMGKGEAPVFADRPSEELLDEFAKALGMEVK